MKNHIGLILSGGGAKGAYEIGVCKALEKIGVMSFVDIIAGASVGAINAVLVESQGADYAEYVWQSLRLSDMLHVDLSGLAKHNIFSDNPNFIDTITDTSVINDLLTNGLPVSQKKIEELINIHVDFGKIKRKIIIPCTESDGHLEYFILNNYPAEIQKRIILASSAMPLIYRGLVGVEINNRYYYDGGMTDDGNTPVPYLYESGCKKIIAVHLRYDADITNQYFMKDADIVNIIPSKNLGSFLSGTLNLNHFKVYSDIETGYEDTMAMADEIISVI
ncbi:MAG: patatin-like phospholipase family protein [Ruminococcus sp.]|nr:patatin-like phospholipase family protein [Ruminococcus sp.]